MPSVTVDVDDLEALLFATSGIKDLEAALDQRRRNPMVTGTKGKLEGAHDRLSTAWRRAKREVDFPKIVVTAAEIAELRSMFTGPDGKILAFISLPEYPCTLLRIYCWLKAGHCGKAIASNGRHRLSRSLSCVTRADFATVPGYPIMADRYWR